MLQHIKRDGFSMMKNSKRLINIFSKSYNKGPCSNSLIDVGFAQFSSLAAKKSLISDYSKRVACQVGGNSILLRDHSTRRHALMYQFPSLLAQSSGENSRCSSFVRSFASKATESNGKKEAETRKAVSTVEDPFDAPTYNIPEKPVTFTEGASYSLVILAGLGIAAAAAYGVFRELIFEPKEYKIFNKALERIQNDGQVRVRIGSPITGYGSESRNRAARQRVPHKRWLDEDGVEHIVVNFHVRGPHGAGKVFAEMFKDEKEWKFMYLIVEVTSPTPAQLMLESYVPA